MASLLTWTSTPPSIENLKGTSQFYWLRSDPLGACPTGTVVRLNPSVRLGSNGQGLAEITVELRLHGYPEFLWMSQLSDYPHLTGLQWSGPLEKPAESA